MKKAIALLLAVLLLCLTACGQKKSEDYRPKVTYSKTCEETHGDFRVTAAFTQKDDRFMDCALRIDYLGDREEVKISFTGFSPVSFSLMPLLEGEALPSTPTIPGIAVLTPQGSYAETGSVEITEGKTTAKLYYKFDYEENGETQTVIGSFSVPLVIE